MPSSGVQTCADRKSTRLNSSHTIISYAVFCLKKKTARCTPHPAERRALGARTGAEASCPVAAARPPGRARQGTLRPPTAVTAAVFFFNDTATTEIYTLSLHDALPI